MTYERNQPSWRIGGNIQPAEVGTIEPEASMVIITLRRKNQHHLHASVRSRKVFHNSK